MLSRPYLNERNTNRFDLSVFVGNLEPTVTEGELIRIFQEYGEVKSVSYMWHKVGPQRGQPKGYSFIEMRNQDSVEAAIKGLHQRVFKGRKLVVKHSHANQTHDYPLPTQLPSISSRSSESEYRNQALMTKRKIEESQIEMSDSLSRKRGREIDDRIRKIQETLHILQSRS